jgi:hypothetical protein
MVLTLRSTDRPLRVQVQELCSSFTRLRRRKWWRERVSGGVWTFELTWNADTNQWHPHLHILAHATWTQLQELSQEWLRSSRGSHRVHVSLVNQHDTAIREVSKYVGKLLHRTWEHIPALVVCCMRALDGLRLANTFGTWRGTPLDQADEPDPSAVWELWGTLDRLYELARTRDKEALDLLAQLHGRAAQVSANKLNPRPPPGDRQAANA